MIRLGRLQRLEVKPLACRWAMGSDEDAPLFIRECLTVDSTIPVSKP